MPFETFIRCSMLPLCATILAAGAHAAPVAPRLSVDQLKQMPPALVQRLLQRGWRAPTGQSPTETDVTPPSLTKFVAQPSFDANAPGTGVVVNTRAADDLSGVWVIGAVAYGPDGHSVYVNDHISRPAKGVSGPLGSTSSLSGFDAPGEYTFVSAYVSDFAGNYASYDQAALALLGNITFTVKNKAGYDNVAPGLAAGRIQTPKVSLSDTQPGTDSPPFIGVTIDATDAGNTALAGVSYAYADFCTLDGTACLSASSYNGTWPAGQAAATLLLGREVSPGYDVPGRYHLYSVYVDDFAGNYAYWVSTEFGGDTDFGAYFPSTTITIKP